MKKVMVLMFLTGIGIQVNAQDKKADTVIIRVGEGSKVIFAIKDRKDLETLRKYNFQSLMDDMITKLENKDTTVLSRPSSDYLKDTARHQTIITSNTQNEVKVTSISKQRYRGRRTHHSFNFDLGTNNYLENGKFPDQSNSLYTVKPWGSWYIAINSIQRTRLANKFYLEWGYGVSWYNFKFQDSQVNMSKDANSVIFAHDQRPYAFVKSKLTATFANVSLVPMIDFGGGDYKPSLIDGRRSRSFRFGVGPYAGYRLDSYAKQVFKINGDTHKERNHDNFYLNNFRYGIRAQFGFRDVDFFFNYDMNSLYADTRGPQLNAFSFGVTF